ncbi:MAG: endolytic transglycosylase MltG [Candidatus Doudnabacteria bacterium]|nr:endolytic transglycosylase MltG [Candidatus Doudnabacteria bacterium]
MFKPKADFSNKAGEELIKKALDNFCKKITPDMLSDIKARDLTLFDIITLASIIEKETGRNAITPQQKQMLDEERKIIAGIFYNRLNIGMALESDATINYITGRNNPSPTQEDLSVNSPYNTYKNKGLPPGPISNPSLSSIMAAIYPAQTDYFYFLHKQPSGEAVFSKTFEEHVKNKFKYLK